MIQPSYRILFTPQFPEMPGEWQGSVWREVLPLAVNCRRPEGSTHHPRTFCKLLYDDTNIYGIFRVEDQYVRSIHTLFQSEVWKDSCVEFSIPFAVLEEYIGPLGAAAGQVWRANFYKCGSETSHPHWLS